MTLSNTDRKAEGASDGIVASGPENSLSVGPHPEVDGCAPLPPVTSGNRLTQPWKTGQSAPESSGFVLGKDRPD